MKHLDSLFSKRSFVCRGVCTLVQCQPGSLWNIKKKIKKKFICLALLQSRVWWWRQCVFTSCLHYKWRDKCNVLFKRSFPPKPPCILLKRSSSRAAEQCSPLLHPRGGRGLPLIYCIRLFLRKHHQLFHIVVHTVAPTWTYKHWTSAQSLWLA